MSGADRTSRFVPLSLADAREKAFEKALIWGRSPRLGIQAALILDQV